MPPIGYLGSVVWEGSTGSWARIYVSKLVYLWCFIAGNREGYRERCRAYFISKHGAVDHIVIVPTTAREVA